MPAFNLSWGMNTPATLGRLSELVLYIAQRTKGYADFGAVKLNKTLYHSDMEHYRVYGRPLTGAQYHRIQKGPVPKHILVAERTLKERGALEIDTTSMTHKRIAKRDADLTGFSEEQIKIVDRQIERLKSMTSTEVSDDSHDIRWHAVNHQGRIPYEFAFLDGTATPKDEADAGELAIEFGW